MIRGYHWSPSIQEFDRQYYFINFKNQANNAETVNNYWTINGGIISRISHEVLNCH